MKKNKVTISNKRYQELLAAEQTANRFKAVTAEPTSKTSIGTKLLEWLKNEERVKLNTYATEPKIMTQEDIDAILYSPAYGQPEWMKGFITPEPVRSWLKQAEEYRINALLEHDRRVREGFKTGGTQTGRFDSSKENKSNTPKTVEDNWDGTTMGQFNREGLWQNKPFVMPSEAKTIFRNACYEMYSKSDEEIDQGREEYLNACIADMEKAINDSIVHVGIDLANGPDRAVITEFGVGVGKMKVTAEDIAKSHIKAPYEFLNRTEPTKRAMLEFSIIEKIVFRAEGLPTENKLDIIEVVSFGIDKEVVKKELEAIVNCCKKGAIIAATDYKLVDHDTVIERGTIHGLVLKSFDPVSFQLTALYEKKTLNKDRVEYELKLIDNLTPELDKLDTASKELYLRKKGWNKSYGPAPWIHENTIGLGPSIEPLPMTLDEAVDFQQRWDDGKDVTVAPDWGALGEGMDKIVAETEDQAERVGDIEHEYVAFVNRMDEIMILGKGATEFIIHKVKTGEELYNFLYSELQSKANKPIRLADPKASKHSYLGVYKVKVRGRLEPDATFKPVNAKIIEPIDLRAADYFNSLDDNATM